MAKLNYFLLAESVVIAEDGKTSLINLFDILNSVGTVATPIKFTLAIAVTSEKKDIQNGKIAFRVEILNPKQKQIFKAEGGGEVPDDKIGSTVVSPLDLAGAVQFDQEGVYEARLFVNNQLQSTLKFTVLLNQKVPE